MPWYKQNIYRFPLYGCVYPLELGNGCSAWITPEDSQVYGDTQGDGGFYDQ